MSCLFDESIAVETFDCLHRDCGVECAWSPRGRRSGPGVMLCGAVQSLGLNNWIRHENVGKHYYTWTICWEHQHPTTAATVTSWYVKSVKNMIISRIILFVHHGCMSNHLMSILHCHKPTYRVHPSINLESIGQSKVAFFLLLKVWTLCQWENQFGCEFDGQTTSGPVSTAEVQQTSMFVPNFFLFS